MKNAYIPPTPTPRPRPAPIGGQEPERPRKEDGSRETGGTPVFDDECLTPAQPRPIRAPDADGGR